MPERSRLITVARLAMAEKHTSSTAKNDHDQLLLRCENPAPCQSRGDIIMPMKKVKANKTGMPVAEFLVRSMAKMKPKATPRNRIMPSQPRGSGATPNSHAHANGAQHRGHEAQGPQPVGIAQDLVALGTRAKVAALVTVKIVTGSDMV